MTHYQIIVHFSHENLAGCQSDFEKRSKLPSQINSDLTYLSFAIEFWPLNTWYLYCFSLLLRLYTNGLYFTEETHHIYTSWIFEMWKRFGISAWPLVHCSLCVSYILLFWQRTGQWELGHRRDSGMSFADFSIAGVCKRSQIRKDFKHYYTWASNFLNNVTRIWDALPNVPGLSYKKH